MLLLRIFKFHGESRTQGAPPRRRTNDEIAADEAAAAAASVDSAATALLLQDRKKRKRRPPAALLDGSLAVEMPLATVRSSASTSRASTPEQQKEVIQVGFEGID